MHHLSTATAEPDTSVAGCRTWRVGEGYGAGDGHIVTVRELDPGFTESAAADPEGERVFVVLSGELVLSTSSGEHHARARNVAFLPSGVGCRLSVAEPTRVLWISSPGSATTPPADGSSDLVLTNIDDHEGVAMTDPAMGMFDIVSRALVTSDTLPARALLVGHSCFASEHGLHELHRHERDEFMYGVSGIAHALSSEDVEARLEPGDLVYIPAGEWHGLRAMEGEELSEHVFGYLGAGSFADVGYALRG
jgi:quercetin dioxygenase-like cupin family protein